MERRRPSASQLRRSSSEKEMGVDRHLARDTREVHPGMAHENIMQRYGVADAWRGTMYLQ
jgi:hypothetical protein